MSQVLQPSEEFLRETQTIPSICLVLPFEPQIHNIASIERRLRSMLLKAEERLLQQYSTRKALPVVSRLQQLICNISYSRYEKSIALLTSAVSSKLLYLDFAVNETVRTGEDLEIRDIIYAKKNDLRFLVLELEPDQANMYEGTPLELSLIKHNVKNGDCFFTDMDKGLGLILDSYRLPVFVAGDVASLETFKMTTTHSECILGYLPGNFGDSPATALLQALQPELTHWPQSKLQVLIQQLNKANGEGKLSYGVDQVLEAATHKRSRLLVLEESLRHEKINEIIEKVLSDGGDIEFVKGNSLPLFDRIAVVARR